MARKIDVLYFSGTGNTEAVVLEIVKVLLAEGFELRKQSLCDAYEHEAGRELLLALPVNSQAVSPFLWEKIKALPEGRGDGAYVVLTMNESAAILTPMHKLLERKGYVPRGCAEISMPNNLLLGDKDAQSFSRLLSGKVQARQFAGQIIDNATLWRERKRGSAFVSFLSRRTSLPWLMMRLVNRLEVDSEMCNNCGQCIRECPVHNIQMAEHPRHMGNCQFCMRCGALCPKHAIALSNKPESTIRRTQG